MSILTKKIQDSYLSTEVVTSVDVEVSVLQGSNALVTSKGIYDSLSCLSVELVDMLSTSGSVAEYSSKNISRLFDFSLSDSIAIQNSIDPKNAVNTATDLLEIGLTGYNSSKYFRIPNIARLSSGRLIAIYDIRWNNKGDISQTTYNDQCIGMSYSDDDGQTWTAPTEIINWLYPEYDSNKEITVGMYQSGASDSGIVYDQTNNVVFVFAIAGKGFNQTASIGENVPLSSASRQQLAMSYSKDNGLTWSTPTTVNTKIYDEDGESQTWANSFAYLFSSCGTGIVLKNQQNSANNGKLIMPIQLHPNLSFNSSRQKQREDWFSCSRFGMLEVEPTYDNDKNLIDIKLKILGKLIGEDCGGADEGQICEGPNGEIVAVVKSYRGIVVPNKYASFQAVTGQTTTVFHRIFKTVDLGQTWTCKGNVHDDNAYMLSASAGSSSGYGNSDHIEVLLSSVGNNYKNIASIGFERYTTTQQQEGYQTGDNVYVIGTTESDLANVNYSNIYLSSVQSSLYPDLGGIFSADLASTDNVLPDSASSLHFYFLSSVVEPFGNYKVSGHAPYIRSLWAQYSAENEPTFMAKTYGNWFIRAFISYRYLNDYICTSLEATYRLKPCICYSPKLDLYILGYSNALYTSNEATYRRRYIMLRSSKDLCQWKMFDQLEVLDNMGYMSFVQTSAEKDSIECIYEAYNNYYGSNFAQSTAKQLKFCRYDLTNKKPSILYNHHQEVGYISTYNFAAQGLTIRTDQFSTKRKIVVKGVRVFSGYNFATDIWCMLYDGDSDEAKPIAFTYKSSDYMDNEVYYEFVEPIELDHDSEYFLMFNNGDVPTELPNATRYQLVGNLSSKANSQYVALFASRYSANMRVYNTGNVAFEPSKSFVPCSARLTLVLE